MLETQFIKKLQQKPESIKHIVMWSGIFLIMTIIFTFWLITFPSQIQSSENNEAADNIKKELPNIWQTMKEQVNNLSNLKNIWQQK